MAKYVNVAAVHFEINAERGNPASQSKVLEQLKFATDQLDGTGIDLLLTSEGMGAIGQTMGQAESPSAPGPIYNTYREFAIRNHCTVAGSIKLKDQGQIYNALVYIGPNGEFLGDYRKVFPTLGELERGISPGTGATVIETPAGKLGGVICYDLNFEQLRNQYHELKPDILLFSSMFHGDHLQSNWAYHCRSWFVAACKDNTSDILNPLGRLTASTNYYMRIVRDRVNLDRFVMHLDHNLEIFPDIRRRYGDEISIEANPKLGVAVLYSESDKRNAGDIAGEFGLIQLDELFERSIQAINKAKH